MYTYEEQCMMDLSDNYTLLYSFMGRELIDTFGLEGERALREGTRRYGRDRGIWKACFRLGEIYRQIRVFAGNCRS